jgi:hypothetical protein
MRPRRRTRGYHARWRNRRASPEPISRTTELRAPDVGAAALAASLAVACAPAPAPPDEGTARAERGAYLVTILACNDCHTPFTIGPAGPVPDVTRALSGHPQDLVMPAPPALAPDAPWAWVGARTNTAFAGPWGVSYATNLTPDEGTGMGLWTEETFIAALRSGRHWGGARPILPPMPWPSYGKMTDDDLLAVFAYLRTIPPIRNEVPQSVPAPPPPPPAPAS